MEAARTEMAAAGIVARRYAEAYFDLANDADDVPGWRVQLAGVTEALTAERVRDALVNPRLSVQERTKLGLQLLEGIADPARNLARLLIERGRVAVVAEILDQYDRLADRLAGVVRAEVTAAIPLDKQHERALSKALTEALGRPVEMTVRDDPSIIGGLVVRIGDRVIDDSVRTHLQQLQAALA